MKLLDYRKAMGPAVWLFLLYKNNAEETSDPHWAPVLCGQPTRDSAAAVALKAPIHTVIRWRRRLEKAGAIRTEVCRGGGLKVWVRCSDGNASDSLMSPVAEGKWPTMPTQVVQ